MNDVKTQNIIDPPCKRNELLNTYLAEEQQPPPLAALPQSSAPPEEQHCPVEAVDSGSTGALMETDFINALELSVETPLWIPSVLSGHRIFPLHDSKGPNTERNALAHHVNSAAEGFCREPR